MEHKDTLVLRQYNYDTNSYDDKGEVSIHLVAKSMTKENFAEFIENYCNSFSAEYGDGRVVGKMLQNSHRTLQATAVRFCLGIITGISDVDIKYTDARNVTPVKMGKRLSEMIESGELKMGYMI